MQRWLTSVATIAATATYAAASRQSPPTVVADGAGPTRSLALGAVTLRAVVWARSTRDARSWGDCATGGRRHHDWSEVLGREAGSA
jgi:hypothetical protein